MKKNNKKPDINFNSLTGRNISKIFNVSLVSLHNWVGDGCPRNSDGTYNSSVVYNWRMKKIEERFSAPVGLKEQKLKKEIEFLQARIEEKKDQFIERSEHELIMASRAGSLRAFFEKTFMANAIYLAGKTVDEVRTLLYQLVQSAMEAYLGKSSNG